MVAWRLQLQYWSRSWFRSTFIFEISPVVYTSMGFLIHGPFPQINCVISKGNTGVSCWSSGELLCLLRLVCHMSIIWHHWKEREKYWNCAIIWNTSAGVWCVAEKKGTNTIIQINSGFCTVPNSYSNRIINMARCQSPRASQIAIRLNLWHNGPIGSN